MSETLLAMAFAFMLVVCRSAAAVMLLPALGEADPPPMMRAGLAFGIAVLLTPVVAPSLPKQPEGFLPLAGMIANEILAGALLGWLARLIALALPACGQLISLMTGLSSVLQPDPALGAQSAAIGRLLNLAAPVVILTSGLYALPLTALGRSYQVFPAGVPLSAADMAEMAVRAVSDNFALALQLAAPFILIAMIWQGALGLLARLVPQIQVYFAAMPGQVLGGMLLLALLGTAILGSWTGAVQEGFAALP